jgi:hypothetical protein
MTANEIIALVQSLPGGNYVALSGLVVLAAKLITVWTPTRADDAVMDKLLGFVNVLALNVGKDRNKDA